MDSREVSSRYNALFCHALLLTVGSLSFVKMPHAPVPVGVSFADSSVAAWAVRPAADDNISSIEIQSNILSGV